MRLSLKAPRAAGLFGWLALALLSVMPLAAGGAQASDVRVLIDISGSMRQNDPQNLRRPALRMLAGLLQPGTRAGVWTFARWVNNLVPVAEVDAAWRRRTQSLSEQIASPGQFTNIEDVLERASRDWIGAPTTHARHLLLLTDGVVDISKDPRESEASRARILDTLLPRLKKIGAKVHTIALSERADHDLLRRLAGETGGLYHQVAQADELQRVFLRMFEAVASPDALPLDDNRFVVDGSISEVTVLVFSKPGGAPVLLRAPTGETFTDSDLPAGVAWFRDQGYALITIAGPKKGEWVLQADSDPDNRVMIVTDLQLQTSAVPGHIAVGEQAQIEASLTNRGQLVDREAFLRLLEVYASAVTEQGAVEQAVNDTGEGGDAQAGDGRYTLRYADSQPREAVELLIAVDSPTFMRERRLHLAVHEPFEARIVEGPNGPLLSIAIQAAVIKPGAEVTAWQEDARGRRLALAPVEAGTGKWSTALHDPAAPAYVKVSGSTVLGNPIERIVGPLIAPGAAPPLSTETPPVVEPPPAEPIDGQTAESVPDAAQEEPVRAETASGEAGWLLPAALFAGLNLVFLVAALGWLWWRRRRGDTVEDLDLDDLVIDESAAPAGDGATQARGAA